MGSGRPIGKLLGVLGVRGLIAESVNGLGFKNCISYGFPALACPGVVSLFDEGDRARVDFTTGVVENITSGKRLDTKPLPEVLLATIRSGGVVEMLLNEGLIELPARPEPRGTPVSLGKGS